jgi:hypothetical protein
VKEEANQRCYWRTLDVTLTLCTGNCVLTGVFGYRIQEKPEEGYCCRALSIAPLNYCVVLTMADVDYHMVGTATHNEVSETWNLVAQNSLGEF